MKAKSKKSQAALIRDLLAKKLPPEQIVARVRKSCGGTPTLGYVNAIAKESA